MIARDQLMFDRNLLQTFLNNFKEEKRIKLLDVYLMSLGQHIDSCKNAAETKDAEKLKGSAHDLKSLSYTLGAQDAGDIARDIEAAVIENRHDYALENTDKLLIAIQQLVRVLQDERASME